MAIRLAELQLNAAITQSGNVPGPPVIVAEMQESAGEMYESGMYESGMYESSGYSSLPTLTGTLDTGVISNVLPRASERVQILGRFKVTFDGVEVPPRKIIGPINVSERLDGARVFSFGMAGMNNPRTEYYVPDLGDPEGSEFADPFGDVWVQQWTGAPPGKQEIDIVYLAPTETTGNVGYEEIPIITKGIIENAERSYSAEGDHWQLNGVGREQRADRQLVDLIIPPGAGLSPGELIRKILEELPELENDTIPEFNVSDAPCYIAERRDKEVQVNDQPGWQVATEILGLWNFRLSFDRDGELQITYMGERPDDDPDWTLYTSDLTAEGFRLAPANDGPTRVRVTGTKQLTSETGDGTRTETQVIEVQSIYAPIAAEQKTSDSSGNLEDSDHTTSTPVLRLTQRTTYIREYNLDTLISETVETEGYRIEEIYAAIMNGVTGSLSYTVNRLVWQNQLSTSWIREYFGLVTRDITTYNFESRTVDGEEVEVHTGYLKETYGLWWRREHVAQIESDGGLDWNATLVSWQGEGMVNGYTSIAKTDEEFKTFDVTDDLYVQSETTDIYAWSIRPGHRYYYATGETSSDQYEEYRKVQSTSAQYSATGDSSAVKTTTTKGITGKILQVVTEDLDSYLPAAKIKESTRADLTEYPNAHYASRNSTEAFEILYISEALEANRQAYEEQYSNAWLEDSEEAMCYAKSIVKERSTIPVTFSMPMNVLIRPGQKVNVNLGIRPVGNDSLMTLPVVSCYVTEVVHSEEVSEDLNPSLTHVTGKVYVV